MTTGSDYPDFQSYANWRGPVFGNESAWPLSETNPFTAFGYVTNYASLIINTNANNPDGTTAGVTFYTDNTLAVAVGTYSWTVAVGQYLQVMIPILSNWAAVEISTTDATATDTVIAIVPTSNNVGSPQYLNDQNYVAGFDISIPESSTQTYVLPYVSSGRCSIHFQDLSASGKVSAYLWTASGLAVRQQRLYNSNDATGPVDVSLNVPAVPLILQVANSDTVAHSVDYYCCVDGGL